MLVRLEQHKLPVKNNLTATAKMCSVCGHVDGGKGMLLLGLSVASFPGPRRPGNEGTRLGCLIMEKATVNLACI